MFDYTVFRGYISRNTELFMANLILTKASNILKSQIEKRAAEKLSNNDAMLSDFSIIKAFTNNKYLKVERRATR